MSKERRIKVLIVDDMDDTRENIRKLLMFESDIEVVGLCPDGHQAIDQTRQLTPDIVVMDVNMPGLDGITATEVIRAELPGTQIIMMSVQEEADYLRRAMLAGAREFLVKPFTGEDLALAVRRVYERADRHPAPVAKQTMDVASPVESEATAGQIITLFSAKGGVGRTTLACNLAVALKECTGKSVALVDASLSFGDVGVLLNLQPTKTITDLLPHLAALDGDLLRDLMVRHSSGVDVLLAPTRPETAELVTADALKRILTRLRESYSFVVVDTAPNFHDTMLAVLDLSDRIYAVLTLEMPAIKDVKLFLEVVDVLGYPSEKVSLVLNRADSKGGINVGDVEQNLSRPIPVRIPADIRLATNALNQGVPLVTMNRKSGVTKGILELAELASRAPGQAAIPKARSARSLPILGRFFGKRNQVQLAGATSK